jgi:type I restriction enzyme M protein
VSVWLGTFHVMGQATDQKEIVRSLRNYLAGQAVGLSRDETLLDELLKSAFCFRYLGSNLASEGDLDEAYRAALESINAELPGLFEEGDSLRLSGDQLRTVHEGLSRIDFDDPQRDIVGDIYEVFVGSSYRGQEGQFFTPSNAVRALVEITDPTPTDRIIDPACGAGAFLLQAGLHAGQKNGGRLPALFGVDKDGYLARLARIHLALQFKQPFPAECADSLAWSAPPLRSWWDPAEAGNFSLVLTNPPFGSKIVALSGDLRADFQLAHKWKLDRQSGRYAPTDSFTRNTPPQVLFLERCLALLADGGRLGIVLPESVLSNVGHRHVMQFLLAHSTPEAVLGMPEALFKTSGKGGTHTKVCLLVLRKGVANKSHSVFMAEAKWCGHDSRGRSIERDELPEIVQRYMAFRQGELVEQDRLGFAVERDQLDGHILAPKYHDPEPRKQVGRLSTSHYMRPVEELLTSGQLAISTGHEVGKLAYGEGDIPFVRTTDLSSWEIKVDPKHLVSEETYEKFAPKQDVKANDLFMVRDGTYLIGTTAYVTEHDTRIVYQSHLYKLRLMPDEDLNSFLLLAILSSRPVRAQIKSLAFTQDIIDSLGDRIREVVLPVPRSAALRDEITSTVERVIADRVEARELARRATRLVAE